MANNNKVSKMSNGGRQKRNLAHEAKRQAKFKAKREAGKAYEYKPIPFEKGTKEYEHERMARAEKAKSKRLPIAIMRTQMAKLDNQIAKEKELALKNKANRKFEKKVKED